MDIVKIGYFIRECRKNKNLTQKQLADKLYVEPKTISKWETGKGLPDVSIMKNLCNELGISLSELFIGDYIKEESNDLLIEKLIIDELKKEKIQNKKKLIGEILIGCAFIGSVITLILLVGIVSIATYLKIILIVLSFIFIFVGLFGLVLLDVNIGYFECAECHERFIPSIKDYVFGMHTLKKRKLKCPICGKKTWCLKRMTRK
ncbi:MAG: helix-turn-helix transcriptional regulator [Bacilli bacterium]